MYESPKFDAGYTPARASTRSERSLIIQSIEDLQTKLARAEQKAEFGDVAFMRLKHRYAEELKKATACLAAFDEKHKAADAARESPAADKATKACLKAAREFERDLLALAQSAVGLKNAGCALAEATATYDPGCWPSKQSIDTAVRARIIDVLGGVAEIKLDGYGSAAKRPGPIDERFGGAS